MKNRTIIGIICMVVAVAITFLVAPLVNRLTSDTVSVLRLSEDVKHGTQITQDQLEVVKVKKDTLPSNVVNSPLAVLGKYASTDLFAGDYLTEAKLSGESNTADDVFASLDGSKVAFSVTIDTFAAGLSGKLQNGDIISFIVVDKGNGSVKIPGELTYVRIITTTTSGGIDKNDIVKNDDGSFEIPSTVTVLVNPAQAKLLAQYGSDAKLQAALVYRGNKENADKFLSKQEAYFKTASQAPAEPTADSSGGGENE